MHRDHPALQTVDETANRAFAFYDPDDEEDEQDDESVIETGMSTSQTHPVQRGPSIDLTQDEDDEGWSSEANGKSLTTMNPFISSDVIDLTSEPEEHPVGEPEATSSDYAPLPYHALPASECPPGLAAAIASRAAPYFPPTVEDIPETEKRSIADDQSSSPGYANFVDRYDGQMSSEDVQPVDTDVDTDVDSAITEGSVSDMSDVDVGDVGDVDVDDMDDDDVDVDDADVDVEDDYSSTSEVNEYAESYDSMDDDLSEYPL